MPKTDVYECMCGGLMKHKIGTITLNIHNIDIKIHNAPHYECAVCKEHEYDLKDRISSYAVKAYQQGVIDIIYNQYAIH
jgi:YgiT-type zinc finger domain-containing protein